MCQDTMLVAIYIISTIKYIMIPILQKTTALRSWVTWTTSKYVVEVDYGCRTGSKASALFTPCNVSAFYGQSFSLGNVGACTPDFGSCWEGQKSKTFKCIWGGSTAPLSCIKLLQAYLLDVPHSENLYFSVHQIGTVPFFFIFYGAPALMSW